MCSDVYDRKLSILCDFYAKSFNVQNKHINFDPVGFELLPEKITIKELQNLYEAILDVRFDRRNFYNKMKRLEMLEQMEETVNRTSSEQRAELVRAIPSREGGRTRLNPSQKKEAFLFRFNKVKYEELKQKGLKLEF